MSNDSARHPAVQHIVNLVVRNAQGHVLLARYDANGEDAGLAPDAGEKWWLPASELDPYQHPDEAAERSLAAIEGLDATVVGLKRVQSFRGRRGWHISFDYLVDGAGQPTNTGVPADWFDADHLPPTKHGNWERETIDGVMRVAASGPPAS